MLAGTKRIWQVLLRREMEGWSLMKARVARGMNVWKERGVGHIVEKPGAACQQRARRREGSRRREEDDFKRVRDGCRGRKGTVDGKTRGQGDKPH